MKHRPFPKMAGATDRLVGVSPGGLWVALEKIHGAQLVIGVSSTETRFGKRKEWLSDHTPFFGWQLVRAILTDAARAVFRSTESRREIFLYGELFGGGYPHPDVTPAPAATPVQTGVWYAPDLHWALFDILVAQTDDDEGELLAHSEVSDLASGAKLLTPPLLAQGARSRVESVATRFATRVPTVLGLPEVERNFAEGIVFKPDLRAAPSKRFVWKRKIEEFDESRFDESAPWDPTRPLTVEALLQIASSLVNPARIASARSKCGPDDREQLLDEIVLDVMIDLSDAFPGAQRALGGAEEQALSDGIRRAADAKLQ